MMKSKLLFWIFLPLMIFAGSCKNHEKPVAVESISSGVATFVVDESFAPIVDEELYVFKNLNPDAKPNVLYKSQNQVLGLLLNDSVRFRCHLQEPDRK